MTEDNANPLESTPIPPTPSTPTVTNSSSTENVQPNAQGQNSAASNSTPAPTFQKQGSVKVIAKAHQEGKNNNSSSQPEKRKTTSIAPGIVEQRKEMMQDEKEVNEVNFTSNVRLDLPPTGTLDKLKSELSTGKGNQSGNKLSFTNGSLDAANERLNLILSNPHQFSPSTGQDEILGPPPGRPDSVTADMVPPPPLPTLSKDNHDSITSSSTSPSSVISLANDENTGLNNHTPTIFPSKPTYQAPPPPAGRGNGITPPKSVAPKAGAGRATAPMNKQGSSAAVSQWVENTGSKIILPAAAKQTVPNTNDSAQTEEVQPQSTIVSVPIRQLPNLKDTCLYNMHMRFIIPHNYLKYGSGGFWWGQLKEFGQIVNVLRLTENTKYVKDHILPFNINFEGKSGSHAVEIVKQSEEVKYYVPSVDLNIRLNFQFAITEIAPAPKKEWFGSKTYLPPYFEWRAKLFQLTSEQLKDEIEVYINWLENVIKPKLDKMDDDEAERHSHVIDAIANPGEVEEAQSSLLRTFS